VYFELGRLQGLRGPRHGSGTAHLQVFNPAGGMDVSCKCCVLSGRSLCVGLIIHPEEPYRVCCILMWQWNLHTEEAWPTRGCCTIKRKIFLACECWDLRPKIQL